MIGAGGGGGGDQRCHCGLGGGAPVVACVDEVAVRHGCVQRARFLPHTHTHTHTHRERGDI